MKICLDSSYNGCLHETNTCQPYLVIMIGEMKGNVKSSLSAETSHRASITVRYRKDSGQTSTSSLAAAVMCRQRACCVDSRGTPQGPPVLMLSRKSLLGDLSGGETWVEIKCRSRAPAAQQRTVETRIFTLAKLSMDRQVTNNVDNIVRDFL